ncbi:MAG: RNase adapter RapZ [Nitrospirales bacterium]|nr:RNase adapter RapZ [Nitrospirales bacterium]
MHAKVPDTLRLVIVSGSSGSGCSQALKCLEDLGFFCVDNLPPALFEKFTDLCGKSGREVHDVALGIDVRERGFFADIFANLDRLKSSGHAVSLLFLEASDVVLVRRFSESRRPHPFLPQRPALEGIQLERKYLHEIRDRADHILDTSELTVHDLRDWMIRHFSAGDHKQSLKVSLLTFGYKYGVPFDSDLVFDVRFLKNPNFVPTLKSFTGENEAIQQFVLETHDAQVFLQHMREFFIFLFPRYQRERRSHLTIAIGCTGGHHRSVAVGIQIQQICQELGYDVSIRHRDIHQAFS